MTSVLFTTAMTLSLAVTLLAFTGIWLINVWKQDVGLVDYYWAPGFFVIFAVQSAVLGLTSASLLIGTMIFIWSLRLTSHLVERHFSMDAEDGRYAAMRLAGGDSFWWVSLIKIFLLQGLLQWLIATPVHVTSGLAGPIVWSATIWIGILLFAFGFALECVADWQLRAFRKSKPPKGSVLSTGLFSLSRHPNYLGEIVLWFGIGLVAFGTSGSLVSFAGPVLLLLAITLISLPLTDQHLAATRPAFAAYATSTPALIPNIFKRKTAINHH